MNTENKYLKKIKNSKKSVWPQFFFNENPDFAAFKVKKNSETFWGVLNGAIDV